MYKKIIIGKISDHQGTEKTPTHALRVMVDGRKPITVGKLWTRESEYGKYLSGVMQDEFKGEKGTFPGYVIVEEEYIKNLQTRIYELENAIPSSITEEEKAVLNNARAQHNAPTNNLDEIPF